MNRRLRLSDVLKTGALVSLCLLATASRAVYLDADRIAATEDRIAKLRWFNIEGAPEWLAGVAPEATRPGTPHRIVLGPGEESILRVEAPGQLRIRSEAAPAQLGMLEYALSNGSGLFYTVDPVLREDAGDLLLQPDQPEDVVYRIRNRAGRSKPAEFSAYRAVFLGMPDAASKTVPIESEQASVRLSAGSAPGADFIRGGTREPVTLQLKDAESDEPRSLVLRLRMDLSNPDWADARQIVLHIALDGQPWREFFLHSGPERNRLIYLDGRPALAGREETLHFRVPAETESIQLRSSVPVFLQPGAESVPDFLWAGNREASLPADPAGREKSATTMEKKVLPDGSKILDRSHAPSTAEWVKQLFRFSRDHRYRETGTAAIAALRQASSTRAEIQPLQQALQRLSSTASYWRSIHPTVSSGSMQSRSVRIVTRDYRSGAIEPRSFWINPGQMEGELERVLTGSLTSLNGSASLEYSLAARRQPSSLLFAVPSDQTGRLKIQFDEDKAFFLDAITVAETRQSNERPSRSQLAALLGANLGAGVPVSLRTAYAFRNPERPAVEVRTVRIPLPADVRRVRISPGHAEGASLEIAAWVRTSRTATLDESSYLYYLGAAGSTAQTASVFFDALRESLACGDEAAADPVNCWPDSSYSPAIASAPGSAQAARVLRNDWLPMIRLLRSRLQLFRGNESIHAMPEARGNKRDGSVVRARQLMAAEKWLPAFEEWSRVVASTQASRAEQGKLGQVRALQQLGEMQTAEQLLKRYMLETGQKSLREQASQMLTAQYQQEGALRKLTGLRVARMLDGVTAEAVGELVRALLAEGFDGMAIRAHLAAGIETGHEALYSALLRERWLQTLERQLVRETGSVRSLWQGLAAAAQEDFTAALDLLEQAGTQGKPWSAAIREAEPIRQSLGSADLQKREAAIASWQAWWSRYPGERQFTHFNDGVRSSAGAAVLRLPARDLSLTSWRARPEVPVTLPVTGPGRIRVAVRPLHRQQANGMYAAKHGVLNLELEQLGKRRFAYAGNRPSSGVELLSSGDLAGTEIVRDLEIPKGVHGLKIWPGEGEALVRIEREQPVIPLGLLPYPDPLRVAWVRHHGWPRQTPEGPHAVSAGPLSMLPITVRDALMPLLQRNAAGQVWVEGPTDEPGIGNQLIAITPRIRADQRLPTWSDLRPWTDQVENQSGGARLPGAKPGADRAITGPVSQVNSDRPGRVSDLLTQGLSAGDFIPSAQIKAVQHPSPAEMTAIERKRERLIDGFADAYSGDPARIAELMLAAQQYPRDLDIQALASTVRNRGSGWHSVTSVAQSAGVRRVPIRGWSPETPSLRVRRALLGNRFGSGEVLGGGQALTLEMHNLVPTRIRISVREITMLTADHGPVSLDLLLDHQPVGSLRLRDQGITWRTLEISEGNHEVRVEARARTFGQSVHLLIEEYLPDADRWIAISPERTRTYQVATREEPIVYQPAGPTWIRVDEYQDGVVSPVYRFVNGPREKLVLRAEGRQDSAFYRIFEYVARPRPLRLKRIDPTPGAVAEAPVASVEAASLTRQPVFHDRLTLGRQEDGSPSLYAKYALRKTTDPDGIGGTNRDHALDLGLEYRKRTRADGQTSYLSSAIFVREPDTGDPLLGLRSRLDRYRTGSPWSVGGQAALYLQNLDDVSGPAWGARLHAHVSHRYAYSPQTRQTVTLQPFLRGLGLSDTEAARAVPDPDLYSRYKRDHRYGAHLGWSGRHDLFADTRLYARSSLQTNEDLNIFAPDRVDGTIGVDQKLGPLDVGLAYRSRFFFNDADRSEGVTRNRYTLFGEWAHWSHSGSRLNLRVEAARDVERGLWTSSATLAWHFGAGREYTDFRPGEILFRNLRELDLPQTWNPSVDE